MKKEYPVNSLSLKQYLPFLSSNDSLFIFIILLFYP